MMLHVTHLMCVNVKFSIRLSDLSTWCNIINKQQKFQISISSKFREKLRQFPHAYTLNYLKSFLVFAMLRTFLRYSISLNSHQKEIFVIFQLSQHTIRRTIEMWQTFQKLRGMQFTSIDMKFKEIFLTSTHTQLLPPNSFDFIVPINTFLPLTRSNSVLEKFNYKNVHLLSFQYFPTTI